MKKRSVSVVFLIGILFLSASATFLTPSVKQAENPIEQLKTSAGEITIITPENKTHTEPDSGYFPATYGFENDEDGVIPDGWVDAKESPSMTNEIINGMGSHKKILRMDKANTYGSSNNIINIFNTIPEFGTLEFWICTNDVSKGTDWNFFIEGGASTDHVFSVGIDSNMLHCYNGTEPLALLLGANNNEWYHIRVDFECGTGLYMGITQFHYRVFINGQDYGDFPFVNNHNYLYRIRIHQNWRYSNYISYTDAIGYSWDHNYNIGDNFNEGLLIGYDNTTNLDWQGYSIDEQSNKTIMGNTTIPMPADGGHNIQVFGNDTMGAMYESERYFTVNTAPLKITINSPTPSQVVGTSAPSYDISVTGLYDSIWYTFDGGATNITTNSLTGTFNQAAWSALSDGIITIDFYTNNSAGMEGSAQVMVFKDSSEEPPSAPPGISGYDLYLLIGTFSLVSIIFFRKRFKS